jgi:hypothetical protein
MDSHDGRSPLRILAISGSLRQTSSNTALVQAAAELAIDGEISKSSGATDALVFVEIWLVLLSMRKDVFRVASQVVLHQLHVAQGPHWTMSATGLASWHQAASGRSAGSVGPRVVPIFLNAAREKRRCVHS